MSDEIETAIDETVQRGAVGERLRDRRRSERKFVCDFGSRPHGSRIYLDGIDISALLSGITINSSVEKTTLVELDVAAGALVSLRAVLPESRCIINVPQATLEVALVSAMRSIGGDGPIVLNDIPNLAAKLLELLGAFARTGP